MANYPIEIQIGATSKPLVDAFDKAEEKIEEFEKKIPKLAASTNKAGIALGNLGRIASDLPFGFIAIQNNLDPLIDSFGRLSADNKGKFLPTLKALGTALAGPAGLALAFTVVSGAITVAIQKYGSIGGAIDAIFGKQKELNSEIASAAESYAKYNKELKSTASIQASAGGGVEGEIQRVKSLAAIVSDTNLTYQQRNNALQELEKINKTYFGNLDIESAKLGTLTSAVNAYSQATIQSAITKGFETEIGAVNVTLREQENLLKKLRSERQKAQAAPQKIVGAAATVDTRDIIAATEAELKQAKVVTDLRARRKDLNAAIDESIIAYNNITAPINAANAAQKEKEERNKREAASAAKLAIELKREAEARKKSLADFFERGAKVQTIDFTSIFDLDQSAARERFTKLAQGIGTDFTEALKPSLGSLGRDFTIIPPESIQLAIDGVNKVRDSAYEAATAFQTFLAPAIDTVFSAIEQGESVIQSLGNFLKKLVIDLIKAAIKAAIFAAIISAVTGGTAAPISFGAAFKQGFGLGGGGGGGIPGLGGAAAPRFGGTAAFSGGLQLAGQVVFTQRGTDLVGVLNNQNARINRVG